MAGDGWPTTGDLRTTVLGRAWQFEFCQVVALLEKLSGGAAHTGSWGTYADERLRFAPSPKLGPTACAVQRVDLVVDPDTGVERFRVENAFFGLYGMAAPGPAYLFEAAALGPDEEHGEVLRRFLDLFNNRLIALYYRAWRKYRWPLEFIAGGSDVISRRVFALLGLATSSGETARDRRYRTLAEHPRLDAIAPRTRLLRYIGLFSQRVRCPANLRGLLWDYFAGPDPARDEFVEVEEYVPRWWFIEPGRCCKLGEANSRLGSRVDLGDELFVGERLRECLGQFRIVVGPLDLGVFRAFLPDGDWYAAMVALVDMYRPDRLDYDIRLRLRADQVPPLRVGGASSERLGWSTWVRTPQMPRLDEGVVTFQRRDPQVLQRQRASRQ